MIPIAILISLTSYWLLKTKNIEKYYGEYLLTSDKSDAYITLKIRRKYDNYDAIDTCTFFYKQVNNTEGESKRTVDGGHADGINHTLDIKVEGEGAFSLSKDSMYHIDLSGAYARGKQLDKIECKDLLIPFNKNGILYSKNGLVIDYIWKYKEIK